MATKVSASQSNTLPSIQLLFTNHMDAWGMTLMVCVVAQIVHDAVTPTNMLLTMGLVIGYWFAFSINDYFDAPFDQMDAEKSAVNFFTNTSFSKTIILAISLAITCFLLVLFIQFGVLGMSVLALSLFIAWAYSAPPLRLKNRPFLDLLTHGLFVETYPYAVMLLLMQVAPTVLDWTILAMMFCASLAAQLEQQLRDYEIDLLEGENFTIRVGKPIAKRLLQGINAILIAIFATGVLTSLIPLRIAMFGFISSIALVRRFFSTDRSEWLVTLTVISGLVYTVGLLIWMGIK